MDGVIADRLRKFRGLMEERGLDAFLVAVPENRFYFSGYGEEDLQLTESAGMLLIGPSEEYLLTDSRYDIAARESAPGYGVVIYSRGPAEMLPGLFSDLRVRKLGFEANYLTHARFLEIKDALRSSCPEAGMEAGDELAEGLRIIKEPGEIQAISKSLALTERVMESVWSSLTPGRSEKEVAWEIERRVKEWGGEGVSFASIVASGPNGALPHAVPTDRKIGRGELVTVDMGSRLNRYCSDMTRTWAAGTPEARLREIYRIVREAQLAATDAIRAGAACSAVDDAARSFITRAGYGDQFRHGLGHGVGLAVHEPPGLRRQSETILEENMVVTVEPGIYLEGYGGVRLENMVRVTASGCEVLNSADLFYDWS